MTTINENETTHVAEEHEQDAPAEQPVEEESTDAQPSASELQSELAARDERVSVLEEQVITLERELSTTVSRYRLALLDTAPEVPGDLVSGTTAEELESSLAKAKGLVDQVRTRLLEDMESAGSAASSPHSDESMPRTPIQGRNPSESLGIPAGAPPRTLNDASPDLTTREKITLGLERM